MQVYRAKAHGAGVKAVPFVTSLKINVADIRAAFADVGKMLKDSGGTFAFPSPVHSLSRLCSFCVTGIAISSEVPCSGRNARAKQAFQYCVLCGSVL